MYLKKRLLVIFHKVIRKTGFDFVKCKISKHEQDIEQWLKSLNITCVLDIGANEGQFSKGIRIGGYSNKIISFEPIDEPFKKLQKISSSDLNWDVYNLALGNFDGKTEINIAGNSVSSSILDISDIHTSAAPNSSYIGTQSIEIRTLDSIFKQLYIADENIYMKIDTQGFEKSVLLGAKSTLKSVKAIQLEMSVQTLYTGEELYYKLSEYLYEEGFRLIKIVRGFAKSNGELLQFDGLFIRD